MTGVRKPSGLRTIGARLVARSNKITLSENMVVRLPGLTKPPSLKTWTQIVRLHALAVWLHALQGLDCPVTCFGYFVTCFAEHVLM